MKKKTGIFLIVLCFSILYCQMDKMGIAAKTIRCQCRPSGAYVKKTQAAMNPEAVINTQNTKTMKSPVGAVILLYASMVWLVVLSAGLFFRKGIALFILDPGKQKLFEILSIGISVLFIFLGSVILVLGFALNGYFALTVLIGVLWCLMWILVKRISRDTFMYSGMGNKIITAAMLIAPPLTVQTLNLLL